MDFDENRDESHLQLIGVDNVGDDEDLKWLHVRYDLNLKDATEDYYEGGEIRVQLVGEDFSNLSLSEIDKKARERLKVIHRRLGEYLAG